MSRTKPLEGRIPINNRTEIPNVTSDRIGHQVSKASHHFHQPGNFTPLFFSQEHFKN